MGWRPARRGPTAAESGLRRGADAATAPATRRLSSELDAAPPRAQRAWIARSRTATGPPVAARRNVRRAWRKPHVLRLRPPAARRDGARSAVSQPNARAEPGATWPHARERVARSADRDRSPGRSAQECPSGLEQAPRSETAPTRCAPGRRAVRRIPAQRSSRAWCNLAPRARESGAKRGSRPVPRSQRSGMSVGPGAGPTFRDCAHPLRAGTARGPPHPSPTLEPSLVQLGPTRAREWREARTATGPPVAARRNVRRAWRKPRVLRLRPPAARRDGARSAASQPNARAEPGA